MSQRVDLVWLARKSAVPDWPLGNTWATQSTPYSVYKVIEQYLQTSKAVAWLFWDAELGPPDTDRVLEAFRRPGDLWHAGLQLGMSGKPGLIDFVHPTWMLNRDPEPGIEATSWRMSLRACLVRTDVLRQMGGPRPAFRTLAGASLEMGHRYITRGVLMRHVPDLIPGRPRNWQVILPFEDELRFVWYRFGRKWAWWALLRAVMWGYVSLWPALHAWQKVSSEPRLAEPPPYRGKDGPPPSNKRERPNGKVSVLIPTLGRYPYLHTLLAQLRQQTVQPLEILVVDQTPPGHREDLQAAFPNLPLRVLYLEQPGQCSSRNLGLKTAKGEYILFLDDDDEVPPTLIEDHLLTLSQFRLDVSSGVADEVGAGPLPERFTYLRASDVFPTNNTLVRKETLYRSGLFDLAYEHGPRADGDLGMRVYLSGAVMVLNPGIRVLHHHAPRGGLRAHKARTVTFASSRKYITHRHLPSVTEIYLAKRYFTPRQVREMLWLRVLSTFRLKGPWWKQAFKVIVSGLLLPYTLWVIRKRVRAAERMFEEGYPRIPTLQGDQRE